MTIQPVINIKESLLILADHLPEDAARKDVLYEAYTGQEIEMELQEARLGEFAKADEVKSTFAKWDVTIAIEVD